MHVIESCDQNQSKETAPYQQCFLNNYTARYIYRSPLKTYNTVQVAIFKNNSLRTMYVNNILPV